MSMINEFTLLTSLEMYFLGKLYRLQKPSNFCGVFSLETLYNEPDISKKKLAYILGKLVRLKMVEFLSEDFYTDLTPYITPLGVAWVEDVGQKIFGLE